MSASTNKLSRFFDEHAYIGGTFQAVYVEAMVSWDLIHVIIGYQIGILFPDPC